MRILLVLTFFSFFSNAQNSERDAYNFFLKGEYEKSIAIYEKLSEKKSITSYYFPFFNSYYNLKKIDKAESIAIKMYNTFPKSIVYLVDILACQILRDSKYKANRTKAKLYKEINGNKSQAINIANSFNRYAMYSEALKVYAKSEELNNNNDFSLQKASIYGLIGDSEKMIESYLKSLYNNPNLKQNVTSNIQRFLDNNGIYSQKNYNIVKNLLLKYISYEKKQI